MRSTVESVLVLIRKVFTVGKPDSVPLKGCIHLSHDASQKFATRHALTGATNPKSLGEPPDFLFRLAPDWVYPAANIAVRAVSSCLAVSPLPACAGGLFSVTLAVRALTPVPRLREESCSAVSGLSSPFCGANASTVNSFSTGGKAMFGKMDVVSVSVKRVFHVLNAMCFSKRLQFRRFRFPI